MAGFEVCRQKTHLKTKSSTVPPPAPATGINRPCRKRQIWRGEMGLQKKPPPLSPVDVDVGEGTGHKNLPF